VLCRFLTGGVRSSRESPRAVVPARAVTGEGKDRYGRLSGTPRRCLVTIASRAGQWCRDDRDRSLEGGRRRPRMRRWPAGTAVPGVERAPGPVRVLRVRKVETLSGSVSQARVCAGGAVGRPGGGGILWRDWGAKKRMPGSRKAAGKQGQQDLGPSPGWPLYNWPGCRAVAARARKGADVGRWALEQKAARCQHRRARWTPR